MFICCAGLSSNPSFQRTGETPMHFCNEGRDVAVLTLRKHLERERERVCLFLNKLSSSGYTHEWGFSAVNPLVLMLPSWLGIFPQLFACMYPLVPNDIQTLVWSFGLLTEIGSLADSLSVSLAKFRS